MKSKRCLRYNTFKWVSNCCYIDPVLIALYLSMKNFMSENILNSKLKIRRSNKKELLARKKVQKSLIELYKKTIDNERKHSINCNMLREIIKEYPNKDNFHSSDLNDASDFLEYLLKMFDVKKLKVLKNNNIYSKSVLHEVNELPDLNQDSSYKITKFLKDEDGFKIIGGDYLIFRVNRYFDDEVFYKTKIYPQYKFKLGKQILELKSVVVFSNLHYTCYFLCEDSWYYYDDSRDEDNRIEYVGDYKKLIISRPSPLRQGVLYFYEK